MIRIPRPRTSYANVTATLALVVALGGTSYAATALPRNSVGTPQLKNDAVTSAKIKPGNVGPADLSTAAKRLAASGPASPSVVTGLVYDVAGSGAGNTNWRRLPIAGSTPYNDAPFNRAATVSPNRALVARHLVVRLDNDVPQDGIVEVGLVAVPTFSTEPTTISCRITGTAAPNETSCTSAAPGQVPPGSYLYVLTTVSGSAAGLNNPGTIRWGFTLTEKR